MLAQAASGTGKTAAFALPMLHRLSNGSAQRRRVRGLVLVPARELAMQVAEAIYTYARGCGLGVVPVYGPSMCQQVRALQRGADIVVGTLGRVHDHIRRRSLDLTMLQVLARDEADEMLDMGSPSISMAFSRPPPSNVRRRCSQPRCHHEFCRLHRRTSRIHSGSRLRARRRRQARCLAFAS